MAHELYTPWHGREQGDHRKSPTTSGPLVNYHCYLKEKKGEEVTIFRRSNDVSTKSNWSTWYEIIYFARKAVLFSFYLAPMAPSIFSSRWNRLFTRPSIESQQKLTSFSISIYQQRNFDLVNLSSLRRKSNTKWHYYLIKRRQCERNGRKKKQVLQTQHEILGIRV